MKFSGSTTLIRFDLESETLSEFKNQITGLLKLKLEFKISKTSMFSIDNADKIFFLNEQSLQSILNSDNKILVPIRKNSSLIFLKGKWMRIYLHSY